MADRIETYRTTAENSQGVSSDMDRNVNYVTAVVGENNGKLDLFHLTLETRLRHSHEDPLALRDAREAITEAEKRGLIEIRPATGIVGHILHGDKNLYHLKKRTQSF